MSHATQSETHQDVRNELKVIAPGYAETVRARDEVVSEYCKTHGITREEATTDIHHTLAIRSLPAWKNASA